MFSSSLLRPLCTNPTVPSWVQLCEMHARSACTAGPRTVQVIEMVYTALKRRGVDLDCALRLGEWATAAGFVEVRSEARRAKLGADSAYGEILRVTFHMLKVMWRPDSEVDADGEQDHIANAGLMSGDEWTEAVDAMYEEYKGLEDADIAFYWLTVQKPT